MTKKKRIVNYTAKELDALRKRGASRSDWGRSVTQAQLKASIASDLDEDCMIIDWKGASLDTPAPKAVLNMRVDRDVLEFFKKTGRGYQTKINAVLRHYFEHQRNDAR